jgi:tRNA(fMet)-specific endonuclease VapC
MTHFGPYDLLIAGQSLVNGLTLVSGNVREFQRIAGLKLESWP